MVEAESLISDIRRILDNEEPWYTAKRPYYDPYRLLGRAVMQMEALLERIEDCEEVIREQRGEINNQLEDLRHLDRKLSGLESEVSELRDMDRGFS